MNLYKEKILKHSLKGQRRAHHKYLYIDENGRYVYPEDVKNTAKNVANATATAAGTMAKNGISGLKEKVSNTINEQKQNLKDKKYLLDEKRRKYPNLEKANVTSPGGKRVNQITSAHQEGTKKTTALSYQSTHDPISNKVVKVKRDFDANGNQIGVGYSTESSHMGKKKSKKNTEQQRKSAHAGYEADKKAFPEGGSTEELELQKKKTADRKKAKELAKELTKKKEKDQIRSAHQQHTIRERRKSMPGPASAPSLETKKKETEYRKYMKAYPKQKYSADQAEYDRQIQSLRNQKELIEEGKYPYTPSLEKQIEKTKKRKKAKYVRSLYNN